MGVEYSKTSLVDIYTDEIVDYNGSYTQSNGKLKLNTNSKVCYRKDFNAEENSVNTDSLLITVDATGANSEITSRYNSKIRVDVKIQYYAEVSNSDGTVDYVSGGCETLSVTPYLTTETDGKISEYHIETKKLPIKRLEVYIYNTTDQSVSINKFGIYNSLNLTESLSGSLAIECTLTEDQNWNTGLRVKFTTGDLDLKTLKNTDTGKFAGYNVNDKLVVKWTDVNADL